MTELNFENSITDPSQIKPYLNVFIFVRAFNLLTLIGKKFSSIGLSAKMATETHLESPLPPSNLPPLRKLYCDICDN